MPGAVPLNDLPDELRGHKTHDGLPARNNPDGSYSTELSITVTDPRLNGGRPTNIPSLWGGRELDQDNAVQAALKSGRQFGSFGSIDEAVTAARARSASGGAESRAVPLDDLPGDTPPRKPVEMPGGSPVMQGVKRGLLGIPGVGLLQAGAEGVWNSAMKVPAGLAGIAGTLLPGSPGQGARWTEGVRDALSVNPDPDTGDDPVLQLLGGGMKMADRALKPVTRGADEWLAEPGTAQDVVRGGAEALGDIANVVGTGVGVAAARAPTAAARSLLRDSAKVREAGSVAPQAKAAGFNVTPSTVAGTRSTKPKGYAAAMEGPARNPEASLGNAQHLNRRLGDELGVQVDADGRLEVAAFDEARKPAFGVYEEAKAVPGGPSDEYSTAVVKAIQSVDVPTEGAQEVARLLQKYNQVGDSAQLVEDLKNLRRTAGKRREGDTANQVANEALADVQMAIADALEDELGRRAAAAGDAGFGQRLKDARQHLAQLYETERATSGGYVDASQLAARQQKTGRLTGNLQLGAQMGENLPDVFQHPQNAAPASMGRTPEAWGARSFLFRTGERLGGGLLSRRAMKGFNENIPVGPHALDEFNINPVRDRGYPSPMGPNAGPVAPPEPPAPSTPWAGPLSLAPDAPEGFFGGNPRIQQGRQLAENSPLSLEGQPPGPGPLQQFADDLVPLDAEGLGRGIQSDFASQLGPVAQGIDVPAAPGMPTRPRGVSGPRSAQLTDPRLPEGLQLVDDTPPRQALFGPDDEFPGPAAPAAPVMPQGPAPPTGPRGLEQALSGSEDDPVAISNFLRDLDMQQGVVGGMPELAPPVYRGVPFGADPNRAINPAGATHWTPDVSEASNYGPTVGQTVPVNPADLGTISELLGRVGMDPATAGHPGVLMEALRRYRAQPDAAEWARFSYPLDGNPVEYVHFPRGQ